MLRLYFLACGKVFALVARRLWQIERLRTLIERLLVLQFWLFVLMLIGYLLRDILPLVALGFIAWHFHRWRNPPTW